MCGIFGVFNCPKAAELTFLGLHGNQHRAQEYSGIVSCDNFNLYRYAGTGIVQDVFSQETLNQLHGKAAIGHIRYSTTNDNPVLDNSQPIVYPFRNQEVAIAHNGNIFQADKLRNTLCSQHQFKTSMDTEVILRKFCQSSAPEPAQIVFDAVQGIKGSYSLLFLYNNVMIAVRDPWGNRPLSLGKKNGGWFLSSETIAFDILDVEFVREIQPGEILVINPAGCQSWYFDEDNLSEKPINNLRTH